MTHLLVDQTYLSVSHRRILWITTVVATSRGMITNRATISNGTSELHSSDAEYEYHSSHFRGEISFSPVDDDCRRC